MSDSSQTLVIGVDGGGTGCRVAIGTAADGVLARAEGGRANFASDPALAIKNVMATVEAAAESGGMSAERLKDAFAHLGLAGVMTKSDAHRVSSALPYRQIRVTDDRPTALNGALGGEDGFLLSVGTGTIAAASMNGEYRSVGGWGFSLSDQASGAWIGSKCLRAVLLSHDQLSAHSDLTRDVLRKFQDDPNEIVAFSVTAKPADYGAFAPDVIKSARAGDPVGRKVMTEGATYLQQCLIALGFHAGDLLCLTGGVGPHYADYLPAETLSGLRERKGNALDGAFNFALKHFEESTEVST